MINTNLKTKIKGEIKQIVDIKNTATAYSSGLVKVFTTSAMIALMEKTCIESVSDYLDKKESTVGINPHYSCDFLCVDTSRLTMQLYKCITMS
ncbi:MAG: hypothetical protein U9N51_12370 [Bacteroidota bacterium]|nr:hypothetical protein [Bacteroidota bacterium]